MRTTINTLKCMEARAVIATSTGISGTVPSQAMSTPIGHCMEKITTTTSLPIAPGGRKGMTSNAAETLVMSKLQYTNDANFSVAAINGNVPETARSPVVSIVREAECHGRQIIPDCTSIDTYDTCLRSMEDKVSKSELLQMDAPYWNIEDNYKLCVPVPKQFNPSVSETVYNGFSCVASRAVCGFIKRPHRSIMHLRPSRIDRAFCGHQI